MSSTRTIHRVITLGTRRYHVYLNPTTLAIRRMFGRHLHHLELRELARMALGNLPLEAEQLPLPFPEPAPKPEREIIGPNPYAPSTNPLFPSRYHGD